MKLIDSSKKRLAWYSRNYFYAATIAVVLTNILLYALLDYYWEGAYGNGHVSWGKSFDFERILRCFLNNFSHSNLQHVLLNMLCFFVAGLYLERKTGSLGLLGLVLSIAILQGCVCAAADGDISSSTICSPSELRGATKPTSSSAASCLRSSTLPCVSTAALPKYPLPFTLTTSCTISGTGRDFSAARS